MNAEHLQEALAAKLPLQRFVGRRILWLAETASTNDLCLQQSADKDAIGTTIFADRQTAGRGQYGRKWEAPSGLGLLFSNLVPNASFADNAFLIAWAAVGVAEVLRSLGLPAVVKWPNDVLIGSRKVAGILVERRAAPVVGIGLNVNQLSEDFSPEPRVPPTSLRLEMGRVLDRVDIAARLLTRLDDLWAEASEQGPTPLFDRWPGYAEAFGDGPVIATTREGSATGRLLELRPDRGLRILQENGLVARIPADELLRVEFATNPIQ